MHARHLQSLARIEAAHAGVGHWTEQQLHEEHAVGSVVFGVLCSSSHFRHQIRRLVVLADQLVVAHCPPPHRTVYSEASALALSTRAWNPAMTSEKRGACSKCPVITTADRPPWPQVG